MKNIKSKLSSAFSAEKLTSTSITALLIGIVIAVNVIVYTLTSVFGLYIAPAADNHDLSISGKTDALFADAIEAKKSVTVVFCTPEDELPSDISSNTNELGIFYLTAKKFKERYGDFINFEFVNLYTHKNEKGEIVPLESYQIKDENGNPYPLYESSVIFKCGSNHKTVIDITSLAFTLNENVSTSYYTSYCGEEVFAAMVMRAINKDSKKVQFTISHSEMTDAAFASMLECAGYEIDTVNLRLDEIDEETSLIVISNPQSDFQRAAEGVLVRSEIEKLREFVARGGNIYVALDPYIDKLTALEDFLSEVGISYSEQTVDGKLLRDIVKDNDNAITMDRVTIIAEVDENGTGGIISSDIKNSGGSGGVVLSQCASLKLEGAAKPLLLTSSSSSTYAGDKLTDDKGGYCIGAASMYVDAYGKEGGNIFVMPTIYLTANDALLSAGYSNREFVYSLAKNLFGAEDVPLGCNIVHFNTGVLQNLTTKMMRVYTAVIIAVPVVLAATGAVVVIRRKNR